MRLRKTRGPHLVQRSLLGGTWRALRTSGWENQVGFSVVGSMYRLSEPMGELGEGELVGRRDWDDDLRWPRAAVGDVVDVEARID